jgi:hypothetical protein
MMSPKSIPYDEDDVPEDEGRDMRKGAREMRSPKAKRSVQRRR